LSWKAEEQGTTRYTALVRSRYVTNSLVIPTEPPSASTIESAARLEKIGQLKQLGFNPYAYRWESTHHAAELQEICRRGGEGVDLEVAIVSSSVVFGKARLLQFADETGTIQPTWMKKSVRYGGWRSDAFNHLN